MKKFLVLYKASAAAFAEVMKAPPDQQKAGMDAWTEWSKKAEKSIVDMGGPLGKTLLVTAQGASPSRNDLGGYSVIQGESKEAVGDLLKGHPHFKMRDSSIEVVELLSMTGM